MSNAKALAATLHFVPIPASPDQDLSQTSEHVLRQHSKQQQEKPCPRNPPHDHPSSFSAR